MQEDLWATITGTEIKMQLEGEHDRNNLERGKTDEDLIQPIRKSSWKRVESTEVMKCHGVESKLQKRKLADIDYDDYNTEESRDDATKKRCDGKDLINEVETNLSVDNPTQNRSAAAKRQADRTQ